MLETMDEKRRRIVCHLRKGNSSRKERWSVSNARVIRPMYDAYSGGQKQSFADTRQAGMLGETVITFNTKTKMIID